MNNEELARECHACDSRMNHLWNKWVKQKLFAFEERKCRCCGVIEARTLTKGEEE